MLTGKLIRVKHARNKLVPQYIDPTEPEWLTVAEQLLVVYRAAGGRTRGEIHQDLIEFVGEGPGLLVEQGLAKLLEDRCEYEVTSELPPDVVREAVFRHSAVRHQSATFDRNVVLAIAAEELKTTSEEIDRALFADLSDEQRVMTFDECSAEWLLNRYNVSLAQAVLVRSASMEIRVLNETPARFRELFRKIKFHRLMCAITPAAGSGYLLRMDGPLSLFQSTQKYGLQLALFLPALLHCKSYHLTAEVRWGTEKKAKTFELSNADHLKSPAPDFGVFVPKEIQIFTENFKNNVSDWLIDTDPHPVPVDGTIWVPDFQLTHTPTGRKVYVEFLGFWRKVDIESHYKRLKQALPGQFVLVASEQYRADEVDEFAAGPEVYRYKRTPIAGDVAKLAARIAGG